MPTALIGRHAELQLAVDALKQARAGQTTALVLRGEPGIGKSRLLAAVLEQAELLGHRTLVGRLDDLDRFVPFAALRSAFLPVLADEHAELRDALTTDAGAPLPRLATQIERCLRALALVEPVLLAIDDLHAADADTLTILSLLIRRMQGDPVTFVATTRSHLPSSPLLATAIDRLGRDGLATVVDLGPLDAEDVRALARIAAGAVPDELVVRALWDAAKGNPFYVEEGVRSLLASGELLVADGRARLATPGGVPAALRAPSTIVYRLFDLGPDSRAVARALTGVPAFRSRRSGSPRTAHGSR
jgi:predicted ATPase